VNRSLRISVDVIINVLSPLLLGGLIYYFTRSHSIRFLSVLDPFLRFQIFPAVSLPSWAIYNLPDGLWTFAFSSLLLIIWKRCVNIRSIGWLCIPLLSAIVMEFILGTVDIKDIWFILLGGLLPFILHPDNKFLIIKKNAK